jgi:HK97 family phage major capsid protein
MTTLLETLSARLSAVQDRQIAIRARSAAIEATDTPAEDAEDAVRAAYTSLGDEIDTLVSEHDSLESERADLSARVARLDALRSVQDVETSQPSVADVSARSRSRRPERDPFAIDLRTLGNSDGDRSELMSRAHDGIERAVRRHGLPEGGAEIAARALDDRHRSPKDKEAFSRHLLTTGSDEYHEAFAEYARTGSQRSVVALSPSTAGGVLVPFTLDPTIILTNNGSANPFRQISTIKTTATNTWNGVTSAGVSAAWVGEQAVTPDVGPAFSGLQITPEKAAGWIPVTYEAMEDSDFEQQLPSLLEDARDRLEEAAFALGTGALQPFGVVPQATTVASVAAAAFAAADVYNTQAALPPRWRNMGASTAWVASQAQINRIRQFDTAGGSSFWANLNDGKPERLLGHPCYESSSMVGTIATGSKNLLYGDFSQYVIVDRIGMSVLFDPVLKDTATGRPLGEAGWYFFWRTGAKVATPAAFRVLTIA